MIAGLFLCMIQEKNGNGRLPPVRLGPTSINYQRIA